VPEAYRARAGKIPMTAKAMVKRTSAPAPASSAPASPAPVSRRGAASVGPVTLYVSSELNNEAETIAALQAAGIEFTTIDVEKDGDALDHLKERTHQIFGGASDSYAAPMVEHDDAVFFGMGEMPVRELNLHLDWVKRGRPLETPNVFMTRSCPFAKALMEELDKIGQPYEPRDVDSDGDAHGQLVDVTGSAGVPVTMVNGRVIHGYDAKTAQEIVAAAHPPAVGGLRGFFKTLFGS
jgi:glutaredoxin